MNWLKFVLWLSILYVAYYGAMIIWDFFRSRQLPVDEKSNEITFEEDPEPVRNIDAPKADVYDASILSSGGVSLKELFMLAREEAIEFTRPVSF